MRNVSLVATESSRITMEDLVEAYYSCRRNKRNTASAIRFEMNLAANLNALYEDINSGRYAPSRSIAFVVTRPVCREVFAADYRDRIVHHLIINKIGALMEAAFHDDSYSCRKGKGAQYGQRRVAEMMRECSEDYTRECYVMKLDIKSFFMSIDKQLLSDCVTDFVREKYSGADKELLIELIRKTIFHRPELNCERHTPGWFWNLLPEGKSLFGTDGSHGLPIGNLTSQMFAMLFLTGLDRLVTGKWKCRYYGRYVDDMVFVSTSMTELRHLRKKVTRWLMVHKLTLSPTKVYMQYAAHGVTFVGGVLKPGRTYLINRVVGNGCRRLWMLNRRAATDFDYARQHTDFCQQAVNSYLGMMQVFDEYKNASRITDSLDRAWYRYFNVVGKWGKKKIEYKQKYRKKNVIRREVSDRIRQRRGENGRPPEHHCPATGYGSHVHAPAR